MSYRTEIEAFTKIIQTHPKYGQLRDVLPIIKNFLTPKLTEWEKELQEYLDRLSHPNFITWLLHLYGNPRKFAIKPFTLQKRKSYNLLPKSAFYVAQLIPYMFYFPDFMHDIQKQPHFIRDGSMLMRADGLPLITFPVTHIRVYVFKDDQQIYWTSYSYKEKVYCRDNFCMYLFQAQKFIAMLKELMKLKLHDFYFNIEFRVEIVNLPREVKNVRPNFRLFFNKRNPKPIFYSING